MIPFILFGIMLLGFIGYVGWFLYKYNQYIRRERQEQIDWKIRRDAEWAEQQKKMEIY